MIPSHTSRDDAAKSFIARTRDLLADLDGDDPSGLEQGMREQLASFESLASMISNGEIVEPATLAEAIEVGRAALDAVARRTSETREELMRLRKTRGRAIRREAGASSARFVSRRI